MNLTEDLLQKLVEQLEAGESLESSVAGLPNQEAEIVRLIAAMRDVPFPEEEEAVVAAQEARLLAAMPDRIVPAAERESPERHVSAGLAATVKAWLDRLLGHRELSLGVASAVVLLLLAVWFGWSPGGDNEDGVVSAPAGEEVTADVETEFTGGSVDEAPPDGAGNADGETVIAEVPDRPGSSVYLPLVSDVPERNASTAVIEEVQGVVEVQNGDGDWKAVSASGSVVAGQRVRTGELSQATLTFYDGSQAFLGAATEISVDELNALRPEDGFRTVILTQHVGESRHRVQFRNDAGSRYEVKTPAGSGIARGTSFRVLVTPELLTRYTVTEGKVDVTGQNRTVSVTAGQLTTLIAGSIPEDPVFTISGEGEVEATGVAWTIAGQTFQTHAHTIIVGNPQIGDLVRVDGHLLPDGNRVADRIVLLRRAIANRFSLSGQVEAMGETWTIAGQMVVVNDETDVDDAITVGDNVRVDGIILPGGTLQAELIRLEEEAPGLPFRFSGIVQTIGDDLWIISGQSIAVDDETAIDDEIGTGDVVVVKGWILEDDIWLASEIERRHDLLPTFEFTGVVQSTDPWQVAGIGFETRSWTDVSPDIEIGDLVRVRGTILEDGTRVATSITSLSELPPNTVIFIGTVASIDPWIINGLQLVITGETQIIGRVTVGTLVLVQVQLLPEGTWSVLTIRPLLPDFGRGCLIFSSPVIAVNDDAIQVRHWNVNIKRDGRIKIHGDVRLNSVVTVPLCVGWDGVIIVIGDVIVIYQPVVIIIDDGSSGLPDGCRISGKGSIKCSRRSER